jgi:hypothetical protein
VLTFHEDRRLERWMTGNLHPIQPFVWWRDSLCVWDIKSYSWEGEIALLDLQIRVLHPYRPMPTSFLNFSHFMEQKKIEILEMEKQEYIQKTLIPQLS